MAERPENLVGALESRLAEEAGHSDDYTVSALERIEMAEGEENPIGAIALESRLVEEPGYTDDSASKPVARKKKTRKRRHGESTK